jgi:glycosyltransferase involved in cell wall biosynthesis
MITGDRSFGPGHGRYELMREALEDLKAVYWGRGNLRIPDARGFDVVSSQDPFFRGLVALIAARRAAARLNIQIHAELAGQAWWKRFMARFVLRRADTVRAVSARVRAELGPMRLRARVSMLPVFVDLDSFRSIVPAPHARTTVLWVGRFEREKDPLAALEVLRGIRAAGIDARLVMLGSGSMAGRLARAARDLPVAFPGWRDPRSYLAQADLALCTSRNESWGASIVEALAAGVPVVAPDVGVAREAGAIVVPRAELAQAAAQVLRSRARGELHMDLLDTARYQAAFIATL